MKRCVQCHNAVYCSRDCQRKDWPTHKITCSKPVLPIDSKNENLQNRRHKFSKSIFDDDGVELEQDTEYEDQSKETERKPGYLYHNEIHHDVPELKPDSDCCCVTVKANKEKHLIKMQTAWSGDDIFKVLASEVKIPLEKIKVIHKGKMVDKDNIVQFVRPKAVFQVIGEQAANEDGLNQCDISLMMKQLGIDRNTAVVSLRKTGNLVDAIFEAGNK
ncbi:uncharacterized protein LOC121375159 [Gigantopelta aegis]|uniref:uncharacterized protein LOC121375159 n=1 Tax=Gigantopelta aegis TaxID=1735272 RepID=UPI001B88BE95|nr:uncharacterized protein LOC121375159 [Gigantopelta aegis]